MEKTNHLCHFVHKRQRKRSSLVLIAGALVLAACCPPAVCTSRAESAVLHSRKLGSKGPRAGHQDEAYATRRNFDPEAAAREAAAAEVNAHHGGDSGAGGVAGVGAAAAGLAGAMGHEVDRHVDEYGQEDAASRIRAIFPKVDLDSSGKVSLGELSAWLAHNAETTARIQTDLEFKYADADEDGFISVKEFEEDVAGDGTGSGAGSDDDSDDGDDYTRVYLRKQRRLFDLCDRDRDGRLSPQEHFLYSHPEESTDPGVLLHMAEEDVADCDQGEERDGRLSLREFQDCLWEFMDRLPGQQLVSGYHADADDLRTAATMFKSLDTDHSGSLTAKELSAAHQRLHPTEKAYAEGEAASVVRELDSDADGLLTLAEMLDQPWVFYSAANLDEDGEDWHDEL